MAQWINVLRNNSFVNPMQLPLLCRNSRAVTLAEPGFMAGWLAGWLAGSLAGWLAGWLVGRLAGWLAGWLAGRLAGWLAGWLVGWLAGWLASWLEDKMWVNFKFLKFRSNF